MIDGKNLIRIMIGLRFHLVLFLDLSKRKTREFLIFIENSNQSSDIIIQLNMRALRAQVASIKTYRLIETVFSNFNLFPTTNQTDQIDEDIYQLIKIPISYQIANWTKIQTNNDLIKFQIRIDEVRKFSLVKIIFYIYKLFQSFQSRNISCAYWSFEENNGSWKSDNSCRLIGYLDDYIQCSCNHLTHFALLSVS